MTELARDRDEASHSNPSQITIEQPSTLLRQLRFYLAERANYGRLKRTYQPVLESLGGGLLTLMCDDVEFESDSTLSFKIGLKQEQRGWLIEKFQFHLKFSGRGVSMVRIHLNRTDWHDPLKIPRCHFHVGDSRAHIPFPIMSPRLTLYLLCEHIEPDFGLTPNSF